MQAKVDLWNSMELHRDDIEAVVPLDLAALWRDVKSAVSWKRMNGGKLEKRYDGRYEKADRDTFDMVCGVGSCEVAFLRLGLTSNGGENWKVGMGAIAYMYLDEAGNFDFSPKGSKHFIMTCVVMSRPFEHVQELSSVKYDCLESGIDPKKCKDAHKFHAAEDRQSVRDSVFGVIERHLDEISVYSVVIRKNKANPAIRDQATLYLKVFKWLVGYVFSHEYLDEAEGVIVVTDSIPVKKKLADLRGALKKYMNERSVKMGIPYKLYHHRSESDVNLQVADYCCWAIQRKWERGDARSYEIIRDAIKGEGDLFEQGDTVYYEFGE